MNSFNAICRASSLVDPPAPLVARQVHANETAVLARCYRLRHDYFVKQRGWVVAENAEGEERDGYDARALHLAVFSGEEVVAYLRVLSHDPQQGFMLDHDFSALLSEKQRMELPRAGAIEISRLVCCRRSAKGSDIHALELLLKLLHDLCLEQGFERCYIVVEESWLHPFIRRFGVPFQRVGQTHVFPCGTRTVAATATLAELALALQRYRSLKPLSATTPDKTED